MQVTDSLKKAIIDTLVPVMTNRTIRNEIIRTSGVKIKAYKVGTYYRVDILPSKDEL